MMGLTWFRLGRCRDEDNAATVKVVRGNPKKQTEINANDSTYDYAIAA
jgi:hypothetical protein